MCSKQIDNINNSIAFHEFEFSNNQLGQFLKQFYPCEIQVHSIQIQTLIKTFEF